MKHSKIWLVLAFIVGTGYLLSCSKEEGTNIDQELATLLDQASETGSHQWYIQPASTDYTSIPNQDPKNPITAAKVELGKLLFFETGIGLKPNYPVSMTAYSCASCHIPSKGFTAGRFQGIADGAIGFGVSGEGRIKNPSYTGDEVDAQGARPLPVINLAYVTNALWAGSFGSFGVNVGTEGVWNNDTLTAINFKGLEGLEANNFRALQVHRQFVNKDITDSLGYTAMFDAAFPEIPVSERYTLEVTAFAIAAYFRTIFTNEAPFQRWLKGEKTAMNDAQKRGAILFFGKAGCKNCHTSPSLNAMKFFAVGVHDLYESGHLVFRTDANDKRNKGRAGFTEVPADLYKFKVPQLYNLKDVGFYFHGASKTSIRDVIEYFNAGIPENPNVPVSQIAANFKPLGLTSSEMDDLTTFLEWGLFDPNMQRYAPTSVLSGNCIPNNDPQSRIDLGCN